MSEINVENILNQIAQLPPAEQSRLRQMLEQQEQPKPPRDKRVPAVPVPDGTREMKWLAQHAREYAGQWVALDGDRLIAHGADHQKVFAAAKASGVYLPLVTRVEDPDAPPFAGF